MISKLTSGSTTPLTAASPATASPRPSTNGSPITASSRSGDRSIGRLLGWTSGRRGLLSLALTGALLVLGRIPQARSDEPLPELLTIEWRRGPNLPQGFQDSDGGIIGETLLTVGGFCSGQQGVAGKPDNYPRGFLNRVWGLSLAHPDQGWKSLPDFPGPNRQGLEAAVVNNELFCWGGFNYTEPFSYRDGYKLSRSGDAWTWSRLPDLPWPLTATGSGVIGRRIVLCGGADYDGVKGFHSHADRLGKTPRLGARCLSFNTERPADGWQELPPCPGTPRFVHCVAVVGQQLYVFGGAGSGPDPAAGTFTVVDNWRFSLESQQWTRLADLPVASGNFSAGAVVYEDRYVLLIGGYQYGEILNPDGTRRAVYGKPTRKDPANAMCSDVFVYDTRDSRFGRATPLPLNNNLPMAVLKGSRLHLIGGEIGGVTLDGEAYGHHPDLYLTGEIRPAAGESR